VSERKIFWHYGDNVEIVEQPEGFELYYVRLCVGGRDEEGEFMLALDGPAEGERVYL
jgi:hypothetical protein